MSEGVKSDSEEDAPDITLADLIRQEFGDNEANYFSSKPMQKHLETLKEFLTKMKDQICFNYGDLEDSEQSDV